MKRTYIVILVGLFPLLGWAQEIKSDDTIRTTGVDIRVEAEFTKHFERQHLTLGIGEEICARVYETNGSAYFHRSYTSVSLAWEPIPYLKLGTGYTLRLFGNKGWTDPNEFLRHRVTFSVQGQVKLGRVKLSLRERLDINCRTDSVNPLEKSATDLRLRHRIHADYTLRAKPIKLYANCELQHTLNTPVEYLNTVAGTDAYGQYIHKVRTDIGVRWRLNKRNALSFGYVFDYRYERDVNITHKKQNIELTHNYDYVHALVVRYEFDW